MIEESFVYEQMDVPVMIIYESERGDRAGSKAEILHQPPVRGKGEFSLPELLFKFPDIQF